MSKYGIPVGRVTLHLPIKVESFTDFSCSKEHMLNAGEATFGERSLPPAALHYPIGYGGRASSVVVSGTPVVRPHGQYTDGADHHIRPLQGHGLVSWRWRASCGKPSELGNPVSISDADEHIFEWFCSTTGAVRSEAAIGWPAVRK